MKVKRKNKSPIIKLIIIFIFIISTSAIMYASSVIENPIFIEFKDSNLYEAVKNYFNEERSIKYSYNDTTLTIEVSQDDINLIENLNFRGVEGAKISDLTGIENFTNLKILNLTNNNITDISLISELKNITSLDLSNNANIKIYNKQDKICYLPNQENLEELNISSTNNSDISFISKLPKLKIFKASNNGISSLANLNSLTSIEVLDVSENTGIVKIDDILSKTTLKELNISTTGITTLLHSKSGTDENENGIFVLRNLEKLNIENNKLSSINPIYKTYTVIETVMMYGYPVEMEVEVPYLKNLKELNVNYTGNNEIDYDKLILLENLTHLYMKGNELRDVSDQIISLEKLQYINLSDNLIENINWVLRVIEKIDEEGNFMYDGEGNILYETQTLSATKIELAHNRITDITLLGSIGHDITYLDLSENAIYDISVLENGFSFSEGLNLKRQGLGWDEIIYYMPIKDKQVNVDQYIILPSIFQNTKKENSVIYTKNVEFTGKNLSINSETEYQKPGNYNVIIGYEKTAETELNVTLRGGCADGTTLHFKIVDAWDSQAIDSLKFNDANLTAAVYSEIYGIYVLKEDESIYLNKASQIINATSQIFNELDILHLEEKNITDITGLASFENLKYLYLSNNNISSIDELKKSTSLTELYLSNNTNIGNNNSVIKNMINLIKLDLANTKMTNINVIKSLVQNMQQSERAEILLKYLNISDNNIGDIDGINKISSLEELYISNINIKDVSKLSNLTTLKTLNASGNNIDHIQDLSKLRNLKYLNISNNNIEDITPISGISLDNLNFSVNRVKDVTSLTKNYTTLTMDSNLISDISCFEGIRIQNFSVANQKITQTLQKGVEGNVTIDLPEIILASKDGASKVYSAKDYITSNCEISEDGKKVTVNTENLKNQIATIKINGGNAHNTTFSIALPLEGEITYSPTNETITNQPIVATITFNRSNVTITNNDGKDTYTFTENGEFTFEFMDKDGFEGKETAVVTNIDTTAPQGIVSQEIVDKKVLVTIKLSEIITDIDGWTVSADKLSITKTYSEDAEESIILVDIAGNTTLVDVKVKIDKTAPTVTGVENDKTYETSVIPVIEDENLDTIKLSKDEDEAVVYKSGTKIKESGKYVLAATDKFGNETVITFTIELTDKIISLSNQITITEDETNSIISGIMPKTTSINLKEMLQAEMPYDIINVQTNTILDTDKIGTGYQIKMQNGKIYTLIVLGDISGDGEISISELAVASRIASNPGTQIDAIKFKAMDVSKDGTITVPDLAVLSRLRNQ